MNEPDDLQALLYTYVDGAKEMFCENCLNYGKCDYKKQKILDISNYIARYVFERDRGINSYPVDGSWEYQPSWFIDLLSIGLNELNKCKLDKAEIERAKYGRNTKL